jgi:ADP-dependent NAD(P)H-hydrate dehydratase / NAD(P)H-hydrate epimerase
MTHSFTTEDLQKLYIPPKNSSKGDNGQVTIIGGSSLFHGAPLFALTTASRIVDMVFFATPELSVGEVATNIKSKLFSFIWVPWQETEDYVKKSDAILIGPGFMRFRREKDSLRKDINDNVSRRSAEITKKFLQKFTHKKWVIDSGSLQVIDPTWIPKNAILTPNKKEFRMMFGNSDPQKVVDTYNCVLVFKGVETVIYSPDRKIITKGGNAGLTKGGSGDVEAGLKVSFLAKNEPFFLAATASFVVKKAADELFEKVGTNYNSDDLASKIPETLGRLLSY